jgi:hypothetical protein
MMVPESPKEETAFLSFPKAGKDVLHGHFLVGVLPYIMKFEVVVKEHREHHHDDTDYGSRVNEKSCSGNCFPLVGFRQKAVFVREGVGDGGEQSTYKRKYCKEVA